MELVQAETLLKIVGAVSAIVAALFALRKFYQWIRPIRIEPGVFLVLDDSGPDEICATIINRSAESQYIVRCVARGTYSFGYIAMKHIRRPFIPPRLYQNVWFGGVTHSLLEDKNLKIEPYQPIELRHKLSDHQLSAMFTPFFLIELELSSGKVIRSIKLQTPGRWRYLGSKSTKNIETAINHSGGDLKEFPPVEWLSGKDVMQKYNLSGFELYQHIENGLPVYSEDTDIKYKDTKPMEKEEMWFRMVGEKADYLEHDLSNCLFKRIDIEKELKN